MSSAGHECLLNGTSKSVKESQSRRKWVNAAGCGVEAAANWSLKSLLRTLYCICLAALRHFAERVACDGAIKGAGHDTQALSFSG